MEAGEGERTGWRQGGGERTVKRQGGRGQDGGRGGKGQDGGTGGEDRMEARGRGQDGGRGRGQGPPPCAEPGLGLFLGECITMSMSHITV